MERLEEAEPDDGDVLGVVEGADTHALAPAVAAVLERRPDAVVVHGGLRRDDEGTTWGTRTVHTHGTGAATAVAAVNVLLGEESK